MFLVQYPKASNVLRLLHCHTISCSLSPATTDGPHISACIDDITKTGLVKIRVDHTVCTKLFWDIWESTSIHRQESEVLSLRAIPTQWPYLVDFWVYHFPRGALHRPYWADLHQNPCYDASGRMHVVECADVFRRSSRWCSMIPTRHLLFSIQHPVSSNHALIGVTLHALRIAVDPASWHFSEIPPTGPCQITLNAVEWCLHRGSKRRCQLV